MNHHLSSKFLVFLSLISLLSFSFSFLIPARAQLLDSQSLSGTPSIHGEWRCWFGLPQACGVNFTDIAVLSSADMWGVDPQQGIFHWNGSDWSLFAPILFLNSISMVNSFDGWAAGGPDWGGEVFYRWDGQSWQIYNQDSISSQIQDIQMLSHDKGWAIGAHEDKYGNRADLLFWDGTRWSIIQSIHSGWGSWLLSLASSARGWAYHSPDLYFWNGALLQKWTGGLPEGFEITALKALADDNAWAVGPGGAIYHWDGHTWSTFSSPTTQNLLSLDLSGPDSGWAVGEGGAILSWNGDTWKLYPSTLESEFRLVRVAGEMQAGVIFGGETLLLSWTGSDWQQLAREKDTGLDIYGLDMLSPKSGWAVGTHWSDEYSQILHFDGEKWKVVKKINHQNLYGITMRSNTDGWAYGSALFRWDGQDWTKAPVGGANTFFTDVQFASDDLGWGTTSEGLWQYEDGQWSAILEGVYLSDLSVYSPAEAWAVGENGSAYHWDGKVWTLVVIDENVQDSFDNVAQSSAQDVWVTDVESNGTHLYHWDGKKWKSYFPAIYFYVHAIQSFSPVDAWAVGQDGLILHWTGKSWERVSFAKTVDLAAIDLLSPDLGWASGYNGELLYYHRDRLGFLPLMIGK